MHGLSSKTDEKQGAHTLHQSCGVAITLFGFTDFLISGQDLKWTLQAKMKKKIQLCLSAMIYFFRPITSKPLFVY